MTFAPVQPGSLLINDQKNKDPEHYAGGKGNVPLDGAPSPGDVGTIPKPGVGDPPTVPKNGGTGGAGTAVNTPSLKLFATNMATLKEMANTSRKQLHGDSNDFEVKPGAFGAGTALKDAVDGDIKQYETLLDNLAAGLDRLSSSIEKLVEKYDTTEEQNKMDTTKLDNAIADSGSKFDLISAPPKS